jgi:tRNA(Arg) A34 adenosine deaminase TadA
MSDTKTSLPIGNDQSSQPFVLVCPTPPPVEFSSVPTVLVHPSEGQRVLALLSTRLPLSERFRHLKRIRKAPSCESDEERAPLLEVILCDDTQRHDIADATIPQDGCVVARGTVLVPAAAPRTIAEWSRFNAMWPLAVPRPRPDDRDPSRWPSSVCGTVVANMLRIATAVAEVQRSGAGTAPIAAAVIDPVSGRVVSHAVCAIPWDSPGIDAYIVRAKSSPTTQKVPRSKGASSLWCAINGHAVALALRNIAHDDARPSKVPHTESTGVPDGDFVSDDYIGTGLDVYTSHEPCVFCLMCCVHSRVRRLFYAFPNRAFGGAGNPLVQRADGGGAGGDAQDRLARPLFVHQLEALNHRFDAYSGVGTSLFVGGDPLQS